MKIPKGLEISVGGETFTDEIPDHKVSSKLRTMLDRKNKEGVKKSDTEPPKAEKSDKK